MAQSDLKFSNRTISVLKNADDKAAWWYDTDTPGFAVTVSPMGKKVFYFYGRVRGKPTRVRLGTFPSVSVDDARKACRKLVGDVATGKDIALRRKQGRATVADLWAHYLETYAKVRKRTWPRDEKEYHRLIQPEFGTSQLVMIDRTDVEQWIARTEKAGGKGPARKARALLSKMFEVGIEGGWCEKNPVRGTYRPEFDPRQRYLKVEEVSRFFAAVEGLRFETARDFFKLLVFTGARRSNVASMEWSEIDFTARVWIIPAQKAKSKKPIVIPLSEKALEILKRRKLMQRRPSQWVLPSRSQSGHYANPKDAWTRVVKSSGLVGLRIHDLRRSLGAWQQAGGANLKTISQSLGHSTVDVTARFYTPEGVEGVRASVDAALNNTLRAAKRNSGGEGGSRRQRMTRG
jgi:integrase